MFMRELIKQTLKPKNIIKIPFLIETYINNVETNISTKEILKGAKLASKIDIDSIKTDIIPGEGKTVGGTSYYIYDEAKTEALVRNIFKDYLLNE